MKETLQRRARWLSDTSYDHIGIGLVSLAQAIVYAVDKLIKDEEEE